LILDLINTSELRIQEVQPKHIDDIRNAPPLIAFSEAMHGEAIELKQFLRTNLYRHYQVQRMTSKARRCVADLFALFMKEPDLLPPDYLVRDNEQKQARKIADYIAGMTDRYAMREHRRLFCVDDI
jgi:dGTPase